MKKLPNSFTNERMRKLISFVIIAVLASSCGVFKSEKKLKPRDGVVLYAKEYIGTPIVWVVTTLEELIVLDLFTTHLKSREFVCQELLTFCEKRENVFPLIAQNQEILYFLEPPKNENSPMQVLLLDVKEIFLFSFMPHLQWELSFLQ